MTGYLASVGTALRRQSTVGNGGIILFRSVGVDLIQVTVLLSFQLEIPTKWTTHRHDSRCFPHFPNKLFFVQGFFYTTFIFQYTVLISAFLIYQN